MSIEQVIAVAKHEIGVHETGGNNRGPRVEEYLREVGAGPGAAWCAAFVAWALKKAGVEGWAKGVQNRSYCPNLWAWAQQNGILVRSDQGGKPERGDVFLCMDAAGPGGAYHTGFATGLVGQRFATIEGNSNDEGSAEGYEVCARSRLITSCDFVRWAKILELPPALTVTFEGATIPCHPRNEAGTTRADLRKVVEALGFQIVLKPNEIEIVERG